MDSRILAYDAQVWGKDQTLKPGFNYPLKHKRGQNPNCLMMEVWIQQEAI